MESIANVLTSLLHNGATVQTVVNIKTVINRIHLIYETFKHTLRSKCDIKVMSRDCLILYICINVKVILGVRQCCSLPTLD